MKAHVFQSRSAEPVERPLAHALRVGTLTLLAVTVAAAGGLLATSLLRARPWVFDFLVRHPWLPGTIAALGIVACLVMLVSPDESPMGRALLVIPGVVIFLAYATLHLHLRIERETRQSSGREVGLATFHTKQPDHGIQEAAFVPIATLYQLTFTYPTVVYQDQDADITITGVYMSPKMLEALGAVLPSQGQAELDSPLSGDLQRSFQLQEIAATVRLSSNSFSIIPADEVRFPLVGGGPRVTFVVTPLQIGERAILVRSSLEPEVISALGNDIETDWQGLTLSIRVLPPIAIGGLNSLQLQQIQQWSTIIGLPAVLLASMAYLMGRAKKAPSEKRARRKARH